MPHFPACCATSTPSYHDTVRPCCLATALYYTTLLYCHRIPLMLLPYGLAPRSGGHITPDIGVCEQSTLKNAIFR